MQAVVGVSLRIWAAVGVGGVAVSVAVRAKGEVGICGDSVGVGLPSPWLAQARRKPKRRISGASRQVMVQRFFFIWLRGEACDPGFYEKAINRPGMAG